MKRTMQNHVKHNANTVLDQLPMRELSSRTAKLCNHCYTDKHENIHNSNAYILDFIFVVIHATSNSLTFAVGVRTCNNPHQTLSKQINCIATEQATQTIRHKSFCYYVALGLAAAVVRCSLWNGWSILRAACGPVPGKRPRGLQEANVVLCVVGGAVFEDISV